MKHPHSEYERAAPELIRIEHRYQLVRTILNLMAIVLLVIALLSLVHIINNQTRILNSNRAILLKTATDDKCIVLLHLGEPVANSPECKAAKLQ